MDTGSMMKEGKEIEGQIVQTNYDKSGMGLPDIEKRGKHGSGKMKNNLERSTGRKERKRKKPDHGML